MENIIDKNSNIEEHHDHHDCCDDIYKDAYGKKLCGICPVCGNVFEYTYYTQKKIYCNAKCAKKAEKKRWRARHSKNNSIAPNVLKTYSAVCENPKCGKTFEYQSYYKEERHYCCIECRKEHYIEKRCHITELMKLRKKQNDNNYDLKREMSIKAKHDGRAKRSENMLKKSRLQGMKQRLDIVESAKRQGIAIEYGFCTGCGVKFPFIPYKYKIVNDNDIRIFTNNRISVNDYPLFCCKSCKEHYLYTHGKKEQIEKRKLNKIKTDPIIITRWRGQLPINNIISVNSAVIQQTDDIDDSIDITEQLNMFDQVDYYNN